MKLLNQNLSLKRDFYYKLNKKLSREPNNATGDSKCKSQD